MEGILSVDYYINQLWIIEEYSKNWVDIDEYSLLFESDSDPVIKAQQKNEEISEKSSNVIIRLIQNVIRMIQSIIESISNFFSELTMNGDEKAAFNNFREQMKKDPKLKNVKITVKDYRKINEEYDKMLKEMESEMRKAKQDEKYDLSGIINKAKEAINKKVEPITSIIGSETALRLAESDQNTARAMSLVLKHDEQAMKDLEKSLGKREAKKFKKRIDNAAQMTVLTKLMITLRGTRCKNAEDCVKGTINNFIKGGFVNPFTRTGKLMLKNKETRELLKDTGGIIADTGKSVVSNAVRGKVLGHIDATGDGKKHKNKLERKIDKEKKNIKHSKDFFFGKESVIDSKLRDEILDVSKDFYDD